MMHVWSRGVASGTSRAQYALPCVLSSGVRRLSFTQRRCCACLCVCVCVRVPAGLWQSLLLSLYNSAIHVCGDDDDNDTCAGALP